MNHTKGRGPIGLVVVADPDPRIRLMIRAILERVADVCVDASGMEAVMSSLRELRPDWLVLGGGAQGWNPLALAEQAGREFPQVKIILIAESGRAATRATVPANSVVRGWVSKDEILEVRKLILAEYDIPGSRHAR